MTSYRIKNLGIAAGLALAAIILVAAYLTNYKRHVQSGEEHVAVYVAAKPIPAGTSAADLVNSHFIRKTTVLQRNLVPGFVDDPKKLANLYVTRPVFTKEQITLQSFGTANARGIQGQLAGTDRAIEVTGSPQQLLAGTIRNGDHIDVIGAWEIGDNTHIDVSRTFIRDVLVMRAPDTSTKGSITSGAAGTDSAHALLKLSDTQARQLEWMQEFGNFRFSLRSPLQASNGKDAYDDAGTLLLPALAPTVRKAVLAYEKTIVDRLGSSK